MIHVIMGLKGSGKTKKLIEGINAAVASANGDVVCIEFGKKLTYDVTHKVRLVDSQEYGINSPEMLQGLLCGLHAGNFDITNIFVDNLAKTVGNDTVANDALVDWMAKFAADNGMEITVTISGDPASASETMKKYL